MFTGELQAQVHDPGTRHLSDEELQLLVQHQLPASSREAADRHLRECSTCAAQVDELREWAVAASPRVNWSRFAIAAAVVLSVLLPGVIWRARTQGSAAPSTSLAGLETLAPADQTRVRAALDAGTATLPAFIREIATSREVLLGPGASRGEPFDLIAPIATVTISDRPDFRWRPLERADRYVVAVFDQQSNVEARSPLMTVTNWTPSDPLARDAAYVWQVTAHRGSETIAVPAPPSPPARFYVTDARSAENLRRLETEHPQSHLLLGLLYADKGVVDAAALHLKQVQPTDPHVAVARRTLEMLEAVRVERAP